MKKILAISSSGGHWCQLSMLEPLFKNHRTVYACTYNVSNQVFNSKFYKLKDANLKSKLALLILAVQVFFLIIKERPQVIISTGAAPGFFAIFFAKVLFNSKTIWIDSIANGEEPSLSGLKVRKWADLWLTQWPDVAEVFKMKYVGELL